MSSVTQPTLESPPHISHVWRLSWPSIMESLLSTMVTFVDTAMVGSLGAVATAAVAINSSPMWMLNNAVLAISVGSTVLVARAMGAQEPDSARKTARQAILLCLMLASTLTVLVMTFGSYLPRLMGAEPEVLPLATRYIRIVGIAFIPHFLSLIVGGLIRGSGDMRTPLLISFLANVLNVVGNFLFIYPTRTLYVLGFEFTMWGANMGVTGAALATAISTGTAGLIALSVLFARGYSHKGFGLLLNEKWALDRDIWRILRIGLPAALERLVVNFGQIMFLRVVAGLGTVNLAAHHLAITAESIGYMPAFGFSVAATTLVGQSLGAQDPDRAQKYGTWTFQLCLAVSLCSALMLLIFPRQLLSFFTNDQAVITASAQALRIVAFAQPLFAAANVLSGALRGGGDTRWPLLVSFISMWGVRLVVAYICVYALHLGLPGAWYGMVADLWFRGICMILRWRSGKWKTLIV